jgi:DNA invertase Pin-like site-specific DNA recombinase
MAKFIAYYRVSTPKQGKSGLGIAAQRMAIKTFLKCDGDLIGEYHDVDSGRVNNRTELGKAISHAKRTSAKLLIARLDRFSRRVSFIAQIMEQGVGLVCAEMPNASDFQLHIFAALAQEERRLISERTKAALAEARRRGTRLGANGLKLAEKNRRSADDFAIHLSLHLSGEILRSSYSEMAHHLNNAGITTRTGRRFFPQTVKNYVCRWHNLGVTKDPTK